jgi:Ser-tRNA(Ala) deacylase AlaX
MGSNPYVGYRQNAPSDLDQRRLQDLANDLVQQGLKVNIRTIDREEAERVIANAPNLARLPGNKELRIVTIEGQLQIPCGGTHVANLKEIGGVEIRGTEPAEIGFRLLFDVR